MTTTIDPRAELLEETVEALRAAVAAHMPISIGPSQAEVLLATIGAMQGALAASKAATARHAADAAEQRRLAAQEALDRRTAEHQAANALGRLKNAADDAESYRQRLDAAAAQIVDLERELRVARAQLAAAQAATVTP